MAKQELTCDDILKELRAKQYRPIYYLMGEESYYIDLIADYITDNVLSETEKEFNLTVVYGADVDVATIINAAKRYPMMSEHQVVVVKEAQAVRNMEELNSFSVSLNTLSVMKKFLWIAFLSFCFSGVAAESDWNADSVQVYFSRSVTPVIQKNWKDHKLILKT